MSVQCTIADAWAQAQILATSLYLCACPELRLLPIDNFVALLLYLQEISDAIITHYTVYVTAQK